MLADPHQDSSLLEFMYACPVGLVEIDGTGAILMINPNAMKHLLPIATETRRDMGNLFSALQDCAPELRNMLDGFPTQHGTVCENHRILVDLRRQREKARKVLACTVVKLGHDRAIVTFTDVTLQVEQEHRLKLADTWFSSLMDGVNDYAVLAVSADGIIETVNEAFARQTGRACIDVMTRPLSSVLDLEPSHGQPTIFDHFRLADAEGWALDESWQQRRNGERWRCQRLIVARVGEDGETIEGYTVVLRDVVHQAADAGNLRRLLTQDHLTGAANRAHFLKSFERSHRLWQQNKQPLSLILIDIDHFKSINDRYGHPVGDLMLQSLTRSCTNILRSDSLFSRLGGEEFAVLLPNTSHDNALATAERLRAAIAAESVIAAGQEIRITASFGYVTADDQANSVDAMIKMADERLYEAKRTGRNRVCGPTLAFQCG
ncbi:MAG: diguanylate cyclase [Janthinobacterium lividum]